MKKLFLLAIFSLVTCFAAQAELSQKAINMRAQVKSYLSSQGYNPTIDSDGDIKFSYDDVTYYAGFQDYRGNVAVSIFCVFNNNPSLSNSSVQRICQNLMTEYVMAKVYPSVSNKTLRVEIESIYTNSEQVKRFFDTNLLIVSLVGEALLEKL